MKDELNVNRDPHLWSLAKKRAEFKSHFITYLTVILFLWLIWFFTTPAELRISRIPWPLWLTAGWGIAVTLHFVFAYIIKYDEKEAANKEYEKLTKGLH